MSQTIYLDNQATTACDPRVLEAMWPYFTTRYGNASSAHRLGIEANEAVVKARHQVANLLQAQAEEIFFTSGATESNNVAILGATEWYRRAGGKRKRIVTSTIEHKSVLAIFHQLSLVGWDVQYVPVDGSGLINLAEAQQLINDTTLLVSLQAANSEIGTIQPIVRISQLAHQAGALMHCDASQAVGKIPVHVDEWDVDLLSLSGHKMHAPKGIGALYIRRKRVQLSPLLYGGGQEDGLRPGTLPVPLIVGLGEACHVLNDSMSLQGQKVSALRDRLEANLTKAIAALRINGNLSHRLPHNSNITFLGLEADLLLTHLPDLIISTGSACQSGSIEPSNVLINIGMDYEECFCTLRFGLSQFNTEVEIDLACERISAVWHELVQVGCVNFL